MNVVGLTPAPLSSRPTNSWFPKLFSILVSPSWGPVKFWNWEEGHTKGSRSKPPFSDDTGTAWVGDRKPCWEGENGPASLVPRRGPKVSDRRGAGPSLGEERRQIHLAFSHSDPQPSVSY